MIVGNREFEFIVGSDVPRDGMYLEAMDVTRGRSKPVAEVFYSDITHKMTFSVFEPDLPFEILEHIAAVARHRLTPIPT